ncbi:MAG: hypothetical protein RL748_1431 [Pseudomonadota bacterium]|jgi:type IV pilus assembly protein PilY1
MFNKKQFSSVLLGVSLLGAITSNMANAAISQYPLFLGENPNPNIMFTLDNSGSMNWMFLPDAIGCVDVEYFLDTKTYYNVGECPGTVAADKRELAPTVNRLMRTRSPSVNAIFYNPAIRYVPWQKSDGSYYPDSSPDAAVRDARVPEESQTKVNLIQENNPDDKYCPKPSTFYTPPYDKKNQYQAPDVEVLPTCTPGEMAVKQKFIAFYFDYKGPNLLDASVNDARNYTRRQIDASWVAPNPKSVDRTDCKGTVCTYIEEQKNFANWFTYYRKRIFTAIAGVSQAFNPLDGKQRVGFGKINIAKRNANKVDGQANLTVLKGVRQFVGNNRNDFYNRLFENVTPSGGTPLREAMDQVGQYFSRIDDLGPWAENPGVSRGTESACRRSFHILMTDGLWNGNAATTPGADKAESTAGPTIINPKRNQPNYTYDPNNTSNPNIVASYYNGSTENVNTLSNIAMFYWNRDLRPDLPNYVPATSTNPAFWQHLVQYTVGLGVNGTLTSPSGGDLGDEADLKAGRKKWPNPGEGNNKEAVDDLWHAAVNSRGLYFSAKNPKAFRDSLTGALNDIASQPGAASTIALNFDRAGGTNSLAYAAGFDSGSWLGHLVARSVNNAGVVDLTDAGIRWDAANLLPLPANRNIITYNPTSKTGVPFQYANMTAGQKTAVGDSDVVDYLRGSDAKEVSKNGIYRNRATKLGDIVNSSPIYVHRLDHGYGGQAGYSAFLASKTTRNPMVYVGANDGMLHGFDAATGVETFAYVPNSVYPFLKSLTSITYEHHYFVDGKLNEGDAYDTGNSRWRTLLAGSTGAGARSVFMLDVTNPGTPSAPTLSGANLLWEMSGEAGFDNDLGYMLGKIEVVRLRNGKWAAIFGNGYGSGSKKAVLYIVDAFTGNPISGVQSKIVLSSGNSAENGLSQPALLYDYERKLIGLYAGDLQGNVWKVDFDDAGAGTVAFSGAPLFTTKDDAATPVSQPIIQRPAIGEHPDGGYLVMFGTGKYFDTADRTSSQTQTVYGIWDKPSAAAISNTTGRNTALQQQTLTALSDGNASLTSIDINWANKRGWFVDMTLTIGSRAVGNPFVIDGTTLFVTTLTPVPSSCEGGGVSALYSFDYLSGGASHAFDSSDSPTRQSIVNLGAVASEPRVVVSGPTPATTPPPCLPGQTCPQPQAQSGACLSRQIMANNLDRSIVERSILSQCKPPFRTWHLLNN